jgi:Amt family ammonium transporter
VTSSTRKLAPGCAAAVRRIIWPLCLLCVFVCQGCEPSEDNVDLRANAGSGQEGLRAVGADSGRSVTPRSAPSAEIPDQPMAIYPNPPQVGAREETVTELRGQLDTATEGVNRNDRALRDLRGRVDEVLADLSVTRRDLESALQRLEDQDGAIKAQGDKIDSNNEEITTFSARLETGAERLEPIIRQLDAQANQLQRDLETVAHQGSRIEMNGVRIFETLMALDSIEQELTLVQEAQELTEERALDAEAADPEQGASVSYLNPLVTVILCLLVPLALVAGAGDTRAEKANPQNDQGRAAWALTAWFGGGAAYYLVGIGIMFGSSLGGILGTPTEYLPDALAASPGDLPPAFLSLLLVQLSLAAIVSVLVCSVVPPRIPNWAYLLVALPIGGLVYPLFGHWIAVSSATSEHTGWLTDLGFINYAAGPGVALLSGATALFLAQGLSGVTAGDSTPSAVSHERKEVSVVGAVLLWVGWIGVIGAASTSSLGSPSVLLGLAAGSSGAAFSVLILGGVLASSRHWLGSLPLAILAGVVAAPGGLPTASLTELFLLGALAGVFANLSASRLADRFGSNSTLAAVLLSGGLLGTLAPALFGASGFFSTLSVALLVPQLQGIGAALLLALIAGRAFAWSIIRATRLRTPA